MMRDKFNLNHLLTLQQKKEHIEMKIKDEERRPLPDEALLHTWKAERLHLKEEISEYMQKH